MVSPCHKFLSSWTPANGHESFVADSTSGGISGIISKVDITCRIVWKCLVPPTATSWSAMTPNLACYQQLALVITRLTIMVTIYFCHFLVLDAGCVSIARILDISKWLNNTMSNLEQFYRKKNPNVTKLLNNTISNLKQLYKKKSPKVGALTTLGELSNNISPTIGKVPVSSKTSTNVFVSGWKWVWKIR